MVHSPALPPEKGCDPTIAVPPVFRGQRLLGNQFLQSLILLLKLFQPLGLVNLQPSKLPTPTVLGVLTLVELPADLTDALTLGEQNLGLT